MSGYSRGSYNQEGWSFGLSTSLSFNAHTGRKPQFLGLFGGGATVSAYGNFDGGSKQLVTPSFGARLNYYHNFYGTKAHGPELHLWGKANLNANLHGKYATKFEGVPTIEKEGYSYLTAAAGKPSTTRMSIGTNLYYGLGAMSEFRQQTGLLELAHNSVLFRYENDGGFPINQIPYLSDRHDKYRTAAASLCLAEQCLFLNLFTGRRDDESFAIEKELRDDPDVPSKGPYRYFKNGYGTKFHYGTVVEKPFIGFGIKHPQHYRYSTLTYSPNGGGLRLGFDNEKVSLFQRRIHQWIKDPYFEQYSNTWGATWQWNSSGQNPGSLW